MFVEVHIKVEISGDAEAVLRALSSAASASSGAWQRREDLEQRLKPGGSIQFCFESSEADQLWLHSAPSGLSVGFVTNRTRDAGRRECNKIVQGFCEWARPAIEDSGGALSASSATAGPCDWLGEQLAAQLDSALSFGNPHHPADSERWNHFLVAARQVHPAMPTWVLRDWLTEDMGWEEEDARAVAIRYENGLELMEVLESTNGAAQPGR